MKTKPKMHPSEEAILTLKDISSHTYLAFPNFQREGMLPKKQSSAQVFSIKLVPLPPLPKL